MPFAVLQVSLTTGLSTADERVAWALVAALAVGAVVLFATVGDGTSRLHTAIAMAFDFSIVSALRPPLRVRARERRRASCS